MMGSVVIVAADRPIVISRDQVPAFGIVPHELRA